MALVLADRVKETTNTTGTGTLTLAGAVSGFQSFAVIGDGNSTYYAITSGTNWEVGIGTYTLSGTTLSRNTILASSASGSAITVAAGANVFVTYPAGKSIAAGTGYFTDVFTGTYVDGVVIDYSGGNGRISVGGADGIYFYNGGVGNTLLGNVTAGGNWVFNGSVKAGTGSVIGGATNPLIESAGAANGYVQNYIVNNTNGVSSSADIACYPSNGADAAGWIDMGITSPSYADTSFTVTGGNEGYLFMSAPSGASATGNLVLATDSTGTANDIQFYTNGFAQGKTTPALMIKGISKNIGVKVGSPTAALHLPAGGTAASSAALKMTSGSLLTTPEAGAFEYDGSLQYFTPAGTARSLIANAYYYRKNTATTLTSATGNQAVLGLTNGVTLLGNTLYEVEGEFELTTTGTTSHTEAFGFVLTTATVSGMGVAVNRLSGSTTSSALGAYLASVTPVVVTGALTTAQTAVYRVKGAIGISTGGQINPVLAFSAAPGGTSTVVAGAWFKFTPIGTTGSNVSIGTWA